MVEKDILLTVEDAVKKDSVNLDYLIDRLNTLNILLSVEPEEVLTRLSKWDIKRIHDTDPYLVSGEILGEEMRMKVLQIVEMANESL